jgi:hypothetical protein
MFFFLVQRCIKSGIPLVITVYSLTKLAALKAFNIYFLIKIRFEILKAVTLIKFFMK